jgi:hypothetical protein
VACLQAAAKPVKRGTKHADSEKKGEEGNTGGIKPKEEVECSLYIDLSAMT